jgi:hypothetical protein
MFRLEGQRSVFLVLTLSLIAVMLTPMNSSAYMCDSIILGSRVKDSYRAICPVPQCNPVMTTVTVTEWWFSPIEDSWPCSEPCLNKWFIDTEVTSCEGCLYSSWIETGRHQYQICWDHPDYGGDPGPILPWPTG